jgi:hypothetical protein
MMSLMSLRFQRSTVVLLSLCIFHILGISTLFVSAAADPCATHANPPQCRCEAQGNIWEFNSNSCVPPTGGAGGGVGTNGSGGVGTGGSGGGVGTNGSGVKVTELINPLKFATLEAFLLEVISVLLTFALPIIIFFIMYAGYLFVTAAGNDGKISTAKSALLWAVIGGVVILGAKLIITVIQGTVTSFGP